MRFLIVALLCCVPPSAARAQGDTAPTTDESSAGRPDRASAELRLARRTRRLYELQETLRFVEELELELTQTMSRLEQERPSLSALVSELSKAAERTLKGSPSANSQQGLLRTYKRLTEETEDDGCCRWPFFEGDLRLLERRAFYELVPAKFRQYEPSSSRTISPLIPVLADSSLPSDPALLVRAIESAKRQIDALDVGALDRQRDTRRAEQRKELERIASATKTKRKTLEGEIQALEEETAKLRALLDGREEQALSETFQSVYAMMVLLATMFVLVVVGRTWLARNGKSSEIIDDRTLIEFGGMSFILLTVIILGNRDKIEAQTLGALLGTVAGYVFGRGAASGDGSGGTSPGTSKSGQ